MMRTITLEEHYATPAFIQGPGQYLAGYAEIVEQLCDLDDRRIADMDTADIDVQVLSPMRRGSEYQPPDNDRGRERSHVTPGPAAALW